MGGFRKAIAFGVAPVIVLLLCTMPNTAWARVVGLVVDDSGSMYHRFETPFYAAQLLISVLGNEDRLFVTRLSDQGAIQEIDLRNRNKHLESMRKNWSVTEKAPTPYGPVEAMLERLVAVTGPGDTSSLLIVTDGEFTDQFSPPDALRLRYEQFRGRFRGDSLQAFFVTFAPRGAEGDKMLRTIQSQQVRENLLKVFNGSENSGNVVVRDGGQVYSALMDIIALMVGVDPRQQAGEMMELQGTKIRIQAPFTLTRIVMMTAGTRESKPAQLIGEDFGTRERESFDAAMRAADRLTDKALRSNIYHLIPWPPLSPGEPHALSFDAVLKPGSLRMLFETSVKVEWEVSDQAGRKLTVGPSGVIEIPQGESVQVRAFLVESKNGKEERVVLSGLRQRPEFALHYQEQGRPAGASRMEIDPSTSSAVGSIRYDRPGRYTVAVTARYPGFLNKRARDLTVVVREEKPVSISLNATGTGVCPECTAEQVKLFYTTRDFQDVLAIRVRSSAAEEAEYDIEFSDPLPRGVRVLLPDGKPLESSPPGSAKVSLGGGKAAIIGLQYSRDFKETTDRSNTLKVRARLPFKGDRSLPLRFVPMVADLSLELAGTTFDPTGKETLRIKVTRLEEKQGVYLKAKGLQAPLETSHLQLKSETLPFAIEVQNRTNLVLVVPQKKWWCDCLTRAGVKAFEISYLHPQTRQQARYNGTIELLSVGIWEKCWQEILGTLMAILILLKLWCLARTNRFPRHSYLEETQPEDTSPRPPDKDPLHRWWHWFWPLCGNARRKIGVFVFVAGPRSVYLAPAAYSNDYIYDGDLLSKKFEDEGIKPSNYNGACR